MTISRRRAGAGWMALALVAGLTSGSCAPAEQEAQPAAEPIVIADVGFDSPESVLHDTQGDVYLVSNIAGSPLEKDDNGFISRLSPDGAVLDLKWIDGQADGITLNAPKGMAMRGDTLFVADIDSVRLFDRATGASRGSWGVSGATFLNDLAVGPDGTLYASDTGFEPGPDGFAESGTDAVYRFDSTGVATAVAQGPELGRPNGLWVDASGITVVTFGTGEVYRIDPTTGARTPMAQPAGQLDGALETSDGWLLVSSWADSAIHHVTETGEAMHVIMGVQSPADIGYDAMRNRVLIPVFELNRVEIRPMQAHDGAQGDGGGESY